MDCSKLVQAVKKGSSKELEALYKEAFDILCTYLRTIMRASIPDAEDSAQHALVNTIERIRKNAIREPESIYSYMLQCAKNKYLRILYEQKRSNYQYNMEAFVPAENPVDTLVSKEEQQALEDCLDKLPAESKKFIDHWLQFPGSRACDVAERFNISVNNAWTRKHRIVKKISECIRKKINK